MKKLLLILTVLWFASTAYSQAYPPIYTTKLSIKNGNTLSINAPSLSAPYTLTFPVDDGTPNQLLKTDGSGALSWVTINASGTNTGDVTLSGENYLSLGVGQVITANQIDLTGTNVTGQLKAASFPILTGDVTTAGGSLATTIATNAVTTTKIANSNVTLAKIADIADQTILGNNSGIAAAPIALTAAQTKTVLSLNNVENTALSTWAGSANLITLGTVTTGTWNATAISIIKGGTNSTAALNGTARPIVSTTTAIVENNATLTDNTIPKWLTGNFANSSITDNGSTVSTTGNLSLTGANKILTFTGNGAGVSTFKAGNQAGTIINYTLPTTLPTAGQIVTATAVAGNDVTLGWSTTTVEKVVSTDQTVLNSSTLVDAAALTFNLETNSTYSVEGVLYYQTINDGTEIKMAFTYDGTVATNGLKIAASAAGNVVASNVFGSSGATFVYNIKGGQDEMVAVRGFIKTTSASTFRPQFANNNPGGGRETTLKAGSYLRLIKLQ